MRSKRGEVSVSAVQLPVRTDALAKIPLCGLGRYDGKYVQSYLEGK
jgi:hypothetical protein